jgi:hypothetical protein
MRDSDFRLLRLSVAPIFLSSACLMVTQRIDIMYMMVCSIFYVQNDQVMIQALLGVAYHVAVFRVQGRAIPQCSPRYSLSGIL